MGQAEPLRLGYGLLAVEIEDHDLGDAARDDADVTFSCCPFAHLLDGRALYLELLPFAKRLLPARLKREDAPSLGQGRGPDMRQRGQVVHLTICREFKFDVACRGDRVRWSAPRSGQ
jgi:hypothetical protein